MTAMKSKSDVALELRERARELRELAQYVERQQDARGDLNKAAKLEHQADVLEGKAKPSPPQNAPERVKETRQTNPCSQPFMFAHEARDALHAEFLRTGKQGIVGQCPACGRWHIY